MKGDGDLAYSGGTGFSRSTSMVAKGRQEYFGTNVGKLIDSDCFYFLSELRSLGGGRRCRSEMRGKGVI